MKGTPSVKRRAGPLAAALLLWAGVAGAQEPATLTVSKLKDLNIRMYGFLETDVISDSREGFTEEEDNVPVPRSVNSNGSDSFAGKHGRTEFSVRNSRLGLDLTLPKTEGGLSAEGVLEMDFLGNDASNTLPGASGGGQTERDFFNNPALRIRHAYLSATLSGWNAKVGQYWSLLGWQPYYFPSEVIVQPAVGELYRRFAQARATYAHEFGSTVLEAAADAAKPAQMNSGLPELHGGLRLSSNRWKAATTAGAGGSMNALSAAVSGAWIPVRSDIGNANGEAVAFDVFLPLLASKDGQDRSNTLSLTGEVLTGEGVGGLEYAGLTLGVPGVTASTSTTARAGTALDSGIAGINGDGNLELIRVRVERVCLQYTFPNPRWALSAGYAEIDALNLRDFANSNNTNGGGLGMTPKKQFGYVAAFYDPAPWLRLGAEFNQTVDTYNDPNNRHAINNRFQVTSFFIF